MIFYKKIYNKLSIFFLNNWLFFFLIIILFNSSYHFWENSFYVRGLLVDYYIPQLYFNHILLLVFLFFCFSELKRVPNKVLFFLLIFFIFNYLTSYNKKVFLIFLINKLIPFIAFLILFFSPKLNLKYNLTKPILFISTFLFFVFLIQFITKSSFFPYFPLGFFYYKGVTYNIDYMSFFGSKVPIPLAVFPHPNLFAAYLSFLNIFLIKKNTPYFYLNLLIITFLFSITALIFNFLLFFQSLSFKRKPLLLVFFILFYVSFTLGFKDVSYLQRLLQYESFLYLFFQKPFFGWGFGNYLVSLPFFESFIGRIVKIQPLHNIFLLYLLEFGIFGLIYPFVFFKKSFKKYFKLTPFLLFIIVFGISDHFLYTLNQGFMLLLIAVVCHKLIINKRYA